MSDNVVTGSSILVVDDSLFILKTIQQILIDKYEVRIAQSAASAFVMMEEKLPDLILLDWEMPEINGMECLKLLKETPEWKDIPVIFLTGVDNRAKEEAALLAGANDYILKPISAGVLRIRIQTHLELRAYHRELEGLVGLRTSQLLMTQKMILDILANVTTFRDSDTGAHIVRTTNYVKIIIDKLANTKLPGYSLSPDYANSIVSSAKLHDIGKIAIPDGILLKTSKLLSVEYAMVKMHTVFGAQMLDSALKDITYAGFLVTAREIVLHHHEWWNGQGYPDKLKGEQIPISARIMAIADIYDALVSDRPYKKALAHAEAVRVMKKEAGTHLDPILLSIIETTLPDFERIAREIKDEKTH